MRSRVQRVGGWSAIGYFPTVWLIVMIACTTAPTADWSQWGGANRDFTSDSTGLAKSWPKEGPKRLWVRPLGPGRSSVVASDGKLFTMYRTESDEEVVVALDAETGETAWEHKYAAPLYEKMTTQFGTGPNATPLALDNRVYTLGITGKLHCLDMATGEVIWAHDLREDFDATFLQYGFSVSPIAYKKTIIVLSGGKKGRIIAFDAKKGKVKWKQDAFDLSYSSPILIEVDGKEQLVILTADKIIGIDPKKGKKRWSHPHKNRFSMNILTPLWSADDNMLYISSASGAYGLKITRKRSTTKVEEVWSNNKIKPSHANAVRVGKYVYTSISSGMSGPSFIVAVDLADGKIVWQERGFSLSKLISADGKLIVLDEDGKLAILEATPEKLKILAQVDLLEKTAWTPPTLVGTRLFVRDQKTIAALELKN